jgi:hypothetical protein
MSTHAVSFTIARKGDYAERWNSLMAAVRRIANGSTWEETTSFVLLHSPYSASQVLNFLPINVILGDKLLVMDLTNRTHAQKGMDYPTSLGSFFPAQDLGTILGNALVRR